MNVSAEATTLALSLSECVTAQRIESDHRAIEEKHLPQLRSEENSLRAAVDKLSEALPTAEAKEEIIRRSSLMRHLNWIKYWLDRSSPKSCVGDPIDILKRDLPAVLDRFEQWYERQSPTDCILNSRLKRDIAAGRYNAALREAWPLFKTRMVEWFGLPDDLDGDRLVGKLFGSTGATEGYLSDPEREGYLHLFKGLYALNRNLVAHTDATENPEEYDAVLSLINSALVRLEGVQHNTTSANGSMLPRSTG